MDPFFGSDLAVEGLEYIVRNASWVTKSLSSDPMLEKRDNVLHIDATVELRDYFRAHFDAAKTKLIVACIVVATVIAAFTYFFILIGEEDILWKTSPLFFGFPLVAILGQFLRVHAHYRKYIADLSESEKRLHYLFAEDGDGFEIVNGKNFSHISWESVRRVVEKPSYLLFVLSKYDSLIIPKRFLRDKTERTLLRKIILSRLGTRAKLLESSTY